MPGKEPLISVVMRTFNRAHFLPRVIGSVREQTYTNWEMIIVDDASTDATPQVIEELRSVDRAACGRERIKLIRMEKNSGGESTRLKNVGIREAAGKYIALLDDDEWMPTKLAEQTALLERQESSNIGFVGCNALFCYTDGREVARRQPAEGNILKDLLTKNIVLGGSVAIIRSSICKQEGILFDEALVFSENRDLWIRISEAGWEYANAEPLLVRVHMHATNMTNTKNTPRQFRRVHDSEQMFRKHQDLYRRHALLSEGLRTLATYCLLSGDYPRARRHFAAGIRNRATDLKAWSGFILACGGPVGRRLYRTLT